VPKFVLVQASSAFSSLAWCISTEWQFYIFAPLFYRLMKTTAGAVAVTAFVIFSLGWEQVFDFSVNPAHSLLPLQLHWFFIGMVCYLAYQDIEANGLTTRNKLKIAFAVVFVLGLSAFNPRLAPAAVAWLFVVVTLVASLTHKPNFISRMVIGFFDHKITRYFGRISYPVYLVHWPVSLAVLYLLVRYYPQSSWLSAYLILIAVVPVITWPVAHLAHHYLEKPMMEFGKRVAARFPRRKAAVITPGQAVAAKTNQPA
jgi:peptidoglycan/LPS O-acetylase OafA/YrhL